MKVKVTADLSISYEGNYFKKGDEFDIQDSHYEGIKDFVEVVEKNPPEGQETSDQEASEAPEDMTMAQLKQALEKMGKEYPKNARKDDLIALLED